jgi:activating signal cointegrator 1
VRCISLWQPWATLLVRGAKIHETRGWPTNVRGIIGVHAAKKRDEEAREACLEEPFRSALEALGYLDFDGLPFGAIVGTVELVECVRAETVYKDVLFDPFAEEPRVDHPEPHTPIDFYFGNFAAGRWAWRCASPVKFTEPIAFRGAQGFFDVPDAVLTGGVEVSQPEKPLNVGLFAEGIG